MECGDYSIELDRTGFPLIGKRGWGYAISLFPVSKYQFERFMVENGPKGDLYTDRWYRELLKVSPRGSWRRCEERPWELFMTGIGMEAINPLLKYLGRGFRIPEAGEWRGLLEVSEEIRRMGLRLREALGDSPAPPVRHWIEKGLFPLVEEGLLERVRDGDRERFIGKPYPGLLPNTWRPEEVRGVNWDIGRRAVGFRVVKGG